MFKGSWNGKYKGSGNVKYLQLKTFLAPPVELLLQSFKLI